MARKRRHTKETKPENHRELWSIEEDEFIMESELKDIEIAEILGRTAKAVGNRRSLLYKWEDEAEFNETKKGD